MPPKKPKTKTSRYEPKDVSDYLNRRPWLRVPIRFHPVDLYDVGYICISMIEKLESLGFAANGEMTAAHQEKLMKKMEDPRFHKQLAKDVLLRNAIRLVLAYINEVFTVDHPLFTIPGMNWTTVRALKSIDIESPSDIRGRYPNGMEDGCDRFAIVRELYCEIMRTIDLDTHEAATVWTTIYICINYLIDPLPGQQGPGRPTTP